MTMLANLYYQAERVSDSVTRLCENQAYPKKIAFMHIPKCAGSAIMESLRQGRGLAWRGHIDGPTTRGDYLKHLDVKAQNLSFIDYEQLLYQHRQSLLIEHFEKGYPVISGHVPFIASLRAAYPNYFFFTVIRHPIRRWLSYFNFGLKKGSHSSVDIETVRARGLSYGLDAVIDSEAGIFEACLLSLFFSEAGKKKFNVANLSECDCSALTMFDYIGQTEFMPLLEERLLQEGLISNKIKKMNITKERKREDIILSLKDLTSSQKARLEELCSADLALYERVVNK